MGSYTIPSVIEKTVRGGERAVDVYSRLLTDRIIYIGTEIDDGVANVVIAQLSTWSRTARTRRSTLHQLAGRLGHRAAGDLRHHAVHQPPVATTASARPAPRPRCCWPAGDPGRRTVLPHSRVLLHQPSGGGQGTLPDLELQAKEIVRLRAQMEEILAPAHRPRPSSRSGRTPTATWCCPRRRRWTTGWRTRSSTAGNWHSPALELNLTLSFMMEA